LFQVAEGYIQWQYTGDTTWTNLVELTSLVGPAGQDGKEVVLQVIDDILVWQYIGESDWHNLIEINSLKGMSAFEIYRLYYPEYEGTEREWIDDLVNGRLKDSEKIEVTFEYYEGYKEVVLVNKFEKVSKPETPVRDGYNFKGWFIDNEIWSFIGYTVTSEITLKAKWEIINFTVEYSLNGGAFETNPQLIYTLENMLSLLNPVKENATFIDWYIDEEFNTQYLDNIHSGNLSLYAKWDHVPVISYENLISNQYEEIDFFENIIVIDVEDGDLSSDLTIIYNDVNIDLVGNYTVNYEVFDSYGHRVILTRSVIITPILRISNGIYDLSDLPAEEKAKLFAAVETYLLDNVYAGVPLYTGVSRTIFSDRVQLFTDTYNGVMGFGNKFSRLINDDSQVLMYDDTFGNIGEYTWRDSIYFDINTFNSWLNDDSFRNLLSNLNGLLYDYYFDESKNSYEINPALAASEPAPTGGYELNGRTYAKVWRVSLKDGLEWSFHPDTDTSGFAAGYEVLDANDYLWTWKKALQESWFRAISGGGDFISMGIKGAAEYAAAPTEENWAKVGIRKIDDLTFELEFISDVSTFNVKSMFTNYYIAPINKELYEAVGGSENYGTNETSFASSGAYYLDTFIPGEVIKLIKRYDHPDSDLYHYTGYQYRYYSNTSQIWNDFKAGRLESGSIPAAEVQDFLDDPRVRVVPDATTWRLVTNQFGTTANRDAYIAKHPELGLSETYVPEPILMYKEFRQALFFGFDRISATELVPTYRPATTLFSETYFLDAEGGIGVRGSAEGQAVLDQFGGETAGYVPDAAVALFKSAVAQAIADGHYAKGTSANYTTISLRLTWASSGNINAQTFVAELKRQYEALLVDDVNFVTVEIDVVDVPFPDNYYTYMMLANTDLGIAGISGSLLDAPGFLDVFRDDNYDGFTLDWGIDTSSANIDVTYVGINGVEVTERWSANALINALNRKTYVKDGVIQTVWDDAQKVELAKNATTLPAEV
ncbi:InlB B-repeat-containing protein, partial [Acholeplasma laidlawii]|uniref:InlB B-repeat-containing protein n=1 Tax=Acholeplasma laidlawii TaxID=2148 RepID=UPI0018C268B2